MQNTYYSFKNFKNIELKESKNSRTALGTEPDLHFEEEYKYENNSSILQRNLETPQFNNSMNSTSQLNSNGSGSLTTSNPSIAVGRQKRGVRSSQHPNLTSSKSSSERRKPKPANKEEVKQMKILIADDNSINILILSRMLEILPALTNG